MRHIVFMGNCQIFWLQDFYRRIIAPSRDESVTYIAADAALSDESRAAIANADLIVDQRRSLRPDADLEDAKARRHTLPLVTANFLWPYAGRPHPRNEAAPGLPFGPYPDELGDAYLNRMLAKDLPPAAIVEDYMQLDLPRVLDLDRLHEIWLEMQRRRNEQGRVPGSSA